MSKTRRASAAMFVALSLLGASSASAQEAPPAEPTPPERPNLLFILTDDMRADDLRFMPWTRKLVAEEGIAFSNAYVTTPTCCPSRASTLRGQYAHNTGVWANFPPTGGAERFADLGRERSTFATWLDGAGYRTGFVGKYLNGYTDGHVPPGWDSFKALDNGFYRDLKLHEDGTTVDYPEELVTDELLGEKAREFLSAESPEHFMLMYSTHAPHRPADYGPAYADLYPNLTHSPRLPSYEEEDISDKPEWLKEGQAYYDEGDGARVDWDATYRERARSLRVVDDQVASLVDTLQAKGELENTYIFFSSDNGFHFGEHGIWSKGTSYTESLKAPLLVRGPGIEPGSTNRHLTLNTDLGPTFADLADGAAPSWVDGRSLTPLLKGESVKWRKRFLFEFRNNPDAKFYVPNYAGVRTLGSSYTRHVTKEQEFYNLNTDPYQLTSRHKTAKAAVAAARTHLANLKNCAGDGCRTAEGP